MRNSSQQPGISIVLPFYNSERTLSAAVRSILGQTHENWTLYLVDDGSSDSSLQIARSFTDPRVVVVSDGAHLGISTRLNAAIAMASTDYVSRMDADDVAFPQRLERQLAVLQSTPSADVVSCSVVVFRSNGELQGTVQVKAEHARICAQPWRGFIFPHPTWLGRAEWFMQNPYDPENDGAEDQGLLFRTYRTSRFVGIPEVLLAYREDGRTLGKLLGRRLAFWRALGSEIRSRAEWGLYALLCLSQATKVIGDVLATFARAGWARNRIEPPSHNVVEQWTSLRSLLD